MVEKATTEEDKPKAASESKEEERVIQESGETPRQESPETTKPKRRPETESVKGLVQEMPVADAIRTARENSKDRNFEQTWDLIINLKGIDLKKPENRFTAEMVLPNGRGKEPKVAVFADLMANEAKKHADFVITKKELEQLASNKKKMKRIAGDYDFFFAEAPLMPIIGKSLGVALGPRGKMPKPMPPKGDIEPLIKSPKRMVRVILKETPVIYAVVGSEKMKDEDIAANMKAVFNLVKEKLPKGRNNIKSTMIKLTMGKPVKVDMK